MACTAERLAVLEAKYEALEDAIDGGVLRVEHAGRSVTYKTANQMSQILSSLEIRIEKCKAELGLPNGRVRQVRVSYGGPT